jgi:hypothetical protein
VGVDDDLRAPGAAHGALVRARQLATGSRTCARYIHDWDEISVASSSRDRVVEPGGLLQLNHVQQRSQARSHRVDVRRRDCQGGVLYKAGGGRRCSVPISGVRCALGTGRPRSGTGSKRHQSRWSIPSGKLKAHDRLGSEIRRPWRGAPCPLVAIWLCSRRISSTLLAIRACRGSWRDIAGLADLQRVHQLRL